MFTIKFGVTLLYSVPSMILYLLTILIVRRFSKDFSVTFTKLYIAFFVFNNITFFNSFITVRIPQNTCFNCTMSFLFKAHTATNRSWFPLNVFYFIHYNMAYIQFSMIFLTSMNRFSMIFWIKTYEKAWNRIFIIVIIGVIAVPIPLTFDVLINETYYVYTESLDCYTVWSTMDRQVAYNRLLTYIAIVTILTAIVNIASFYKLSCLVSKISIAERNLLFVSGSLFLVQLAADLNTTVSRIFVNDSNRDTAWAKIAVTLVPYVSDGLTLIHPWMFLMFSTRARQCFSIMFLSGKDSTTIGPTSNQVFSVTNRAKSQLETRNVR